jgi:hypothetical protein
MKKISTGIATPIKAARKIIGELKLIHSFPKDKRRMTPTRNVVTAVPVDQFTFFIFAPPEDIVNRLLI